MSQPVNLVATALNKAGITRGNNDSRGVVGRVAGGSSGGRAASSSSAGMEVERDGPGGGRPGRNRKSHTSSTPYSAASRPSRPSLNPSRPGRSSSVPSHSQPTTSSTSKSARPGRREGPSGRKDVGTGGSGTAGSDGGQHVKTLKEWIGTRKRGPGLIDLSAMANDPVLLAAGLKPPGHPDAFAQMGDVVWKVVAEDDIHTHTISLRENNFKNLRQLSRIGFYLPHIRALDLSGNEGITDMVGSGGIDVLSCHPSARRPDASGHTSTADYGKHGLRFLKEIILTGSRLRKDAEKYNRVDGYVRDVLVRFPNLTMLDGQPVPRLVLPVDTDLPSKPIVKEEMDQLKARPYTWPFDVRDKWADADAMRIVGDRFLAKFFELFDNDRNQLLVAYAPNATLSMHFTTAVPPRAKVAGYINTLPNQRALNYDRLKKSAHRNLIHTGPSRWTKSLVVATDETKLRTWLVEDLPKTRHPLSEVDKWMYDVIGMDPVNGIGRIMLVVHGEFAELPVNGLRSFTRTLVIAESAPGTPSQLAGWDGIILSDTFSIRQYCGHVNFTKSLAVNDATIVGGGGAVDVQVVGSGVGGAVAAGGSAVQGIPADIASIPNLSPEQMLVIAQVQAQTNLITQGAADLAMNSGFDLANAGARFEEVKGQIPPELFRQ